VIAAGSRSCLPPTNDDPHDASSFHLSIHLSAHDRPQVTEEEANDDDDDGRVGDGATRAAAGGARRTTVRTAAAHDLHDAEAGRALPCGVWRAGHALLLLGNGWFGMCASAQLSLLLWLLEGDSGP